MTAFDHVGLSVADLEAGVDFYGRAFDFGPEFRFERAPAAGVQARHPRQLDQPRADRESVIS